MIRIIVYYPHESIELQNVNYFFKYDQLFEHILKHVKT